MALSVPAPDDAEMALVAEYEAASSEATRATGRDGADAFSQVAHPFECRLSWVADAAVIEVTGEVDIVTAPELVYAVDLAETTASNVIMDLSEATYLDTWAINALIDCDRRLAEREIPFRVVGPTDRFVRSVFEITYLTEPLTVVESRPVTVSPVDHAC